MQRSDLHYELPPELIAQAPPSRRDASRLLVLDRKTGTIQHERFAHLADLLPPRAVLVFNDTRVLPARVALVRPTGGRLEGLFLRESEPGTWELMLTGAGRVKPGESLTLSEPGAQATGAHLTRSELGTQATSAHPTRRLVLCDRLDAGTWTARPDPSGEAIDILNRYGQPPLPPYILRQREHSEPGADATGADVDRYQTVYARMPGAVAAPTAGLHFTPELLAALRGRGFETHFVTLHVGVGTFTPIRAENLADHVMHEEWYECPQATADAVNASKSLGRAVVAVGTTSVRVLETCATPADEDEAAVDVTSRGLQPARSLDRHEYRAAPAIRAGSGWTRLFIYPPYEFKVVNAMITNFHLPESTLLAMVFAFAGREHVLAAYREAIRERYRFYSYGDAMLIA